MLNMKEPTAQLSLAAELESVFSFKSISFQLHCFCCNREKTLKRNDVMLKNKMHHFLFFFHKIKMSLYCSVQFTVYKHK